MKNLQFLLLITTDGRIRTKQMDKKAAFLRCRFGASSPQAIGVTRKLRIIPIIRRLVHSG